MRWFIAGATQIGAVVARHRVVTRSSAKPCASLARVSAVAGATTMRSAQRASSMWPIAASAAASHRLVRTGSPDRSEEHTSELHSLMRISYAVFCLKKQRPKHTAAQQTRNQQQILN